VAARPSTPSLARVAEGGWVIGLEPGTTVTELLIDCEEDGAPSGAGRDVARRRGQVASSRKDGGTMNRLMRPTLLAFVVSLVVWSLIAVWDADPRAVSSWLLMWQRIAVVVAIVSGLVMLALLVYAAWERLSR
jgi:hypothetical protein